MKAWGYTRPLFAEDDAAADVARLRERGVDDVTVENTHKARDERSRLLEQLQPGDHLVVTSLERLSSTLEDLIIVLNALIERSVVLRCIDSRAKRYAAKSRPRNGRRAGRPRLLDETGIAMVLELHRAGRSIPHIARVFQLSQTTVHRVVTGTYKPR